jgi:hypothetical protein
VYSRVFFQFSFALRIECICFPLPSLSTSSIRFDKHRPITHHRRDPLIREKEVVGHGSEETGVTGKVLFASFARFKAKPRCREPPDNDRPGIWISVCTSNQISGTCWTKEKQYRVVPGLMQICPWDRVWKTCSTLGLAVALIPTTSPHNHTSSPAFPNFMTRFAPQIAITVVPKCRTVRLKHGRMTYAARPAFAAETCAWNS